MGTSYLICILIAAWSATLHAKSGFLEPRLPAIPRLLGITTICVILCMLFALEIAIIDHGTHSLTDLPSYVKSLPIPTIQSGVIHRNDMDAYSSIAVEAISIAESLALLALATLLGRTEDRHAAAVRAILFLAAFALAFLALRAPSMICSDLYLYVGQAEVANPYNPSHTTLAGDGAVINRIWGSPLFPTAYGPLWIALSKITIAPMTTLAGKLLALRMLQAAAVALCIILLIVRKTSHRAVALFAVNPAVYDLFVSEGHNDMVAVAFTFAAASALRASPALAVVLVAAAGMIKLPFLLIGLVAFAPEPLLRMRLFFAASSCVIALCVSTAAAGGGWYLHSMRQASAIYTGLYGASMIEIFLHSALALIALSAIILVVVQRRSVPGFAWSMPAFAPYLPAQYSAWCFPYALLAKKPDLSILIFFPIAAYLLNTDYVLTPLFIFLRATLITIPTLGIVASILKRRTLKR